MKRALPPRKAWKLRAKPESRARSARESRAKPEARAGEGFGERARWIPESFCKIDSEMVQSGAYFTLKLHSYNYNRILSACHLLRRPATQYDVNCQTDINTQKIRNFDYKYFENMRVFSSFLNLAVSVIVSSSTGSRFHACGAATEIARSPVFNLVDGTTRSPFEADRRWLRESTSATGWRSFRMYWRASGEARKLRLGEAEFRVKPESRAKFEI